MFAASDRQWGLAAACTAACQVSVLPGSLHGDAAERCARDTATHSMRHRLSNHLTYLVSLRPRSSTPALRCSTSVQWRCRHSSRTRWSHLTGMATAPDAGTANKPVQFDTQQTTVLRVFYTRPDGKCQVRMDSAAWRARSPLAEHPALLRKQPMAPLVSCGTFGHGCAGVGAACVGVCCASSHVLGSTAGCNRVRQTLTTASCFPVRCAACAHVASDRSIKQEHRRSQAASPTGTTQQYCLRYCSLSLATLQADQPRLLLGCGGCGHKQPRARLDRTQWR